MHNDFRVLLCLFIGTPLLCFALNACSSPLIRTQNVYIPIKCDISIPKKTPAPTGLNSIDLAIWLTKNTMFYQKQLENALKFCIGGKDGE